MDTRFADMPFLRCKEELYYCRTLQDAINADREVTEEALQLPCGSSLSYTWTCTSCEGYASDENLGV